MTMIDEHKKRVQALIKKIQVVAFILVAIIVVVVVFTSLPEKKTSEEEQQTMPPSEKIIFTPPAKLRDATEGASYSHSFCEPDSARSGATCGGLAGATTDPYGGNPPYSFSHQFGVGFIPPGLALELNGLLRGTPTLPGKYTFGICVTDLYKEVCKTTSLTVKSKSEQAEEVSPPEEVTPSVKIESATARVISVDRDPYGTHEIWSCDCTVEMSGTATLPVETLTTGTISLEFYKCHTSSEDLQNCSGGVTLVVDASNPASCPNWDIIDGYACIRRPDQPATGEWSVTFEDTFVPGRGNSYFVDVFNVYLVGPNSVMDWVTLTCCP